MKKILSFVLALVLCVTSLAVLSSCGDATTVDLKVGAILVGDELEGYTLAHMLGMEAARDEIEAETGKVVELSYKKKVPEDNTVETNANSLIADGCTLIITNSYGHQYNFGSVIEENADVTFVSMTGDLASSSGLDNYFNAFTSVYESRFVSGVVAGLKLNELIENSKLKAANFTDAEMTTIKVGYVGAFNYAEVVSGYTAFYLGIKYVLADGYDIDMTVKYTNSWFSEEREASVAEYLYGQGCAIIGQHADSTGAPSAIQKKYNDSDAYTKGDATVCYSVGYNVSMLDVAGDVALTSASNIWKAYYKELFLAKLNGEEIPVEWSKGYADNAVEITALGTACADGTQAKVDEVIAEIKNGTLHVFDVSTFTVDGETLTSYTGAYGMNGQECLVQDETNDVLYFAESSLRSAPYFDIRIDGITEVAADIEEE